ncbi:MAG: MarR family transcriptional regulator [Myxococcales bacterium]|nr:MarR family transcriptional regulator [Myxococcales bacterium]MDH5565114.1 MarR family transcriptional regulator [Myxococcales bacterium]
MSSQSLLLVGGRSDRLALPLPDFRPGIRLLARLARLAEQVCRSTGISLPQYRLLVTIADGPVRASILASTLGVSRPTLTSLVDGLEHAGMLRRVPVASDRRGVRLELAEEGRRAILRAEQVLTERFLGLFQGDTNGTLQRVSGVVADLAAALDLEANPPVGA